jgi:hypothetical protein
MKSVTYYDCLQISKANYIGACRLLNNPFQPNRTSYNKSQPRRGALICTIGGTFPRTPHNVNGNGDNTIYNSNGKRAHAFSGPAVKI